MATGDKLTCPNVCPGNDNKSGSKASSPQPGQKGSNYNPFTSPYIPGLIKPYEPKIYPPNSPPMYLPQPTDTTSGDILGMGPIGPWAAGHPDWTPQGGMVGVRPVVDKYSITRYSTNEWRKNNLNILTPTANEKGHALELKNKKDLDEAFKNLGKKGEESNNKLTARVKELSAWKKKVTQAVDGITEEINTLEHYRVLLKGASKILMLPEAISRECLELRTSRLEPDLVRDNAEQELIKEVSIVGEIRRQFNNTLDKVNEQLLENKAAKSAIEMDWSDKMVSLELDKKNLSLSLDSNLILSHPGVARWPENATTYEYWKHFCSESIRNCNDVRKKSEALRGDLMTAVVKGGQDMKIQSERTNAALAEAVSATEACCDHLEKTLKENLQQIADIENQIDYLKESIRKLNGSGKTAMTRLHSRNYDRQNAENCRDDAQYALMGEMKFIKETAESLNDRVRQAEAVRSELMKYRGNLEKEIAVKRKSLLIDKDRCARVRAHMPSAEEFASQT